MISVLQIQESRGPAKNDEIQYESERSRKRTSAASRSESTTVVVLGATERMRLAARAVSKGRNFRSHIMLTRRVTHQVWFTRSAQVRPRSSSTSSMTISSNPIMRLNIALLEYPVDSQQKEEAPEGQRVVVETWEGCDFFAAVNFLRKSNVQRKKLKETYRMKEFHLASGEGWEAVHEQSGHR